MLSTTPRLGEAPESFVAALGRPEVGRSVDNGFVLRFDIEERELSVLFLGGVAVALRCGPAGDPEAELLPNPRDFVAEVVEPAQQLYIPRPDGSWLLSMRSCPSHHLYALDAGSLS